jgi:hypothetical protein
MFQMKVAVFSDVYILYYVPISCTMVILERTVKVRFWLFVVLEIKLDPYRLKYKSHNS